MPKMIDNHVVSCERYTLRHGTQSVLNISYISILIINNIYLILMTERKIMRTISKYSKVDYKVRQNRYRLELSS